MKETGSKMPLEINWRPEVGKKVEEFFDDPGYKEYLESAASFNRKLNEERKMRLPYIDSQTGVAQRHYNSERLRRERMPGVKQGQIYSYPQKHWRKKKYQYLKYFLQPKRFDPEAEMHTISQVENPSVTPTANTSNIPPNEDSNTSGGHPDAKGEWPYYDEDGFMDEDDGGLSPDSDDEYENSFSKKLKKSGGGAGPGRKSGGRSRGGRGAGAGGFGGSPGGPGGGNGKRRTHADNIPDSEKPFSCELCGAKYKTRPGLSYHYNHTHKEKPPTDLQGQGGASLEQGGAEGEPGSGTSSIGGTPPPTPGQDAGGSIGSGTDLATMVASAGKPGRGNSNKRPQGLNPEDTPTGPQQGPSRGPDGKIKPSAYCDFCLGDSSMNKKSEKPEEMVSCAECGRAGHPTCLQFTDNMIVSVRKYPWQCIECKTCTLCGTSENDDQLLFCDDCDRGYHMYCLEPKITEPPEGNWSCNLCIELFHKKKD